MAKPEILHKCPHCGKFFRHPIEVKACSLNNFDILFKSEEVVRFKLPRIPSLNNLLGVVRYVVGIADDVRTEERKNIGVQAFLIEVLNPKTNQPIHVFYDQLEKVECRNDDEPEIEFED